MHLKRAGAQTAAALAAELRCSLNTVRYHLRELEADGTVVHERARRGVGAPTYVYRLGDGASAHFPERYAGAVSRLLDRLVVLQGRSASAALMKEHYASISEPIRAASSTVANEERGAFIAKALDAEGFMATWEAGVHGGVLTEHHCPHLIVAQRFPEICAAEEVFLRDAFGARVTRQSHIAHGCGTCSYHIVTDGETGQPS